MAPKKPGQIAPTSGQWGIVTKTGQKTGAERTVTRGEPFPPTPRKGDSYILVDKTKH